MKKWLQVTILLLVALSLIACGNKNNNNNASNDQAANTTQNQEDNGVGTGEHAQGDSANTNDGHDNQSRLEVADEAADRVADLEEVDNATVLVTDRNAYVAAVLTNQSEAELTSDLENRIASAVRDADQDIENVYVSVNPDFVERMNEYGTKIDEGQPVEGLFEEFTEAVRRVFPDAR
ncbi:YhcN/YlaJ family sporulation lipoprotein [Sporosarcina sp. FSL W7-1349]|uniref:YhcN/YlaJ family sporulation lipoprotein n=1 Tax=Sporosarcina sp. FSL W7-1349 TaxID=2921561 RepID=UPI0030F986EC